MNSNVLIEIDRVSFSYPASGRGKKRKEERKALQDISLQIHSGSIFGFLGPNGSGKSTLFKLLSTLTSLQEGDIRIFSHSISTHRTDIRKKLGVVFQSPSLDKKLTVEENLAYHAFLYGLSHSTLTQRIDTLLSHLNLTDRRHDLVETLSGGLQRRVEIAKSLLPKPEILIMDEPSSALDPRARAELWALIRQLSQKENLTVLATTHLLDEAEQCHQLALLNEGKIIVSGTPQELKESLGGAVLHISTQNNEPQTKLTTFLKDQNLSSDSDFSSVGDKIRVEVKTLEEGQNLIKALTTQHPDLLDSVTLARPSLEDVYFAKTGSLLEEKVQVNQGAPKK